MDRFLLVRDSDFHTRQRAIREKVQAVAVTFEVADVQSLPLFSSCMDERYISLPQVTGLTVKGLSADY